MGIDAYIETESGELIEELPDTYSLVDELIPDLEDKTSVCLRFIDPYGDTTFNQNQIPVLINELTAALELTKSHKAKEHGKKLLSLIERANGKVHTYLKFIGD
jgi:hypothetical protein